MLTKTYTGAITGIDAVTITVEVDISPGVRFFMVGLPDVAVKESQQRIESALRTLGFRWPGKQVVINLAPAGIRKEGASFDLPLAVGILLAEGKVGRFGDGRFMITGELSLDGTVKPVRGVLSLALRARADGFSSIIVPAANAAEAAVVDGIDVYGMENLRDVTDLLNGYRHFPPAKPDTDGVTTTGTGNGNIDFIDVHGQESVKRALEVAVAGSHNLVMVGPPGSGKTMIAKRIPTIMPPFTLEEALETTRIHSVAGKLGHNSSLMRSRPFRSPHHTISDVALVGGGSFPQPGEISLAHNGVLFLDELPEFKRSVLEVMRQPLEERVVTISRARLSVDYPANFMLIASMNPCPCGYFSHPTKECSCNPGLIYRYLGKLSGPLLDRIDMHIEVIPVEYEKLHERRGGESSTAISERVAKVRGIQMERFADESNILSNSSMTPALMRRHCSLRPEASALMKNAMEVRGLSARAYDRILKVARTIADMEGAANIESAHIAEAINYRSLDREGWAG